MIVIHVCFVRFRGSKYNQRIRNRYVGEEFFFTAFKISIVIGTIILIRYTVYTLQLGSRIRGYRSGTGKGIHRAFSVYDLIIYVTLTSTPTLWTDMMDMARAWLKALRIICNRLHFPSSYQKRFNRHPMLLKHSVSGSHERVGSTWPAVRPHNLP